jgi:hypothetical protein
MKIIFLFLLVITFSSCSRTVERANGVSQPAPQALLPDNPCEVLSSQQVSAITGLEVTSVNRVPSLAKVMVGQRKNREPGPGTICNYGTHSDFGSILIGMPAQLHRHAARYWETRAQYFASFPGAAHRVEGLGMDAWLSGGTTLHVLVRGDEYFTVSTQMYQPRSRELLVNIARAVLNRS